MTLKLVQDNMTQAELLTLRLNKIVQQLQGDITSWRHHEHPSQAHHDLLAATAAAHLHLEQELVSAGFEVASDTVKASDRAVLTEIRGIVTDLHINLDRYLN